MYVQDRSSAGWGRPCDHRHGRKGGFSLAQAQLLPGDPVRVGRYRLTARLGAGGMGVGYLGAAKGGHLVAGEGLRPELAENPEFRARFSREVTTLTRVKGMCTVRVIEADTQAPRPFLVTEYIDGAPLADYIEGAGPRRGRRARGPGA